MGGVGWIDHRRSGAGELHLDLVRGGASIDDDIWQMERSQRLRMALFDAHKPCGAEANMAKHLAAEASWAAADMCVQTHGGFGFAEEYDIERKFREARLYTVAPISTNMILNFVAEHVLGLPRSY